MLHFNHKMRFVKILQKLMQHKLMQDTHLKTNSWTTISRDRSNAYIDLG